MKNKNTKKSIFTGLTPPQEVFAVELSKGATNIEAYVTAFGAGNYTHKALKGKSSVLACRLPVVEYVQKLMKEAAARSNIDRDWIVDKLKYIAEVGTERERVMTVKREKDKGSGAWIEIEETRELDKLVDSSGANSAIDKLIKMQGLYAAEKIETNQVDKVVFNVDLSKG